MNSMFWAAPSFNSDISKWDVSSVTEMTNMFASTNFNGDISEWDVSSVTKMNQMFNSATSFNSDISKWDVSRVADMSQMSMGATSFNHELCGATWVHSTATKELMFEGSSGSILQTSCALTSPVPVKMKISPVFTPRSKSELKGAMKVCLKLSRTGRCSPGPSGPINEWDVSMITNMTHIFASTKFNGDISNWDVSRVTDMTGIFRKTK